MNRLLSFLVVLLWLAGCTNRQYIADMVIYGGTIYTLDEKQPVVEAVAVQNGRIAYAGMRDAAERWIGDKTEVIDLKGRTMIPGFIESHAHLMSLGRFKQQIDLSHATSYEDMIELVAKAARNAEPGVWIIGRGWHQDKWRKQPDPLVGGFQTHEALSAVSPNNPVWLVHASGHCGQANAKAMELCVVGPNSTFDSEGEIIKDNKGNPTGLFNERAMSLISEKIPEPDEKLRREAVQLAMMECLKYGITSFHDACAVDEDVTLYEQLADSNKLSIRLYLMLDGRDKSLLDKWFKRGAIHNDWLSVRAIKLFADGALGSRGAWLLEDYSDMPGHSGMATEPMERVGEIARVALRNNFQLCVHAIGDRANREVLNQFEAAFKSQRVKSADVRFRIEHAQHLHPADIPRFAKLGVIASIQSIHFSSDRPWAIERLGQQRIDEGAYVWQKLLQSGAKVINGTDAPVEPVSPIACYYAAVSRRTLEGQPPGGYEPAQRMSREEALRTYTLDAAYGGFDEARKGSIELGKFADFTILDRDILKVEEDKLLDTKVEMTIVGGKVRWKR